MDHNAITEAKGATEKQNRVNKMNIAQQIKNTFKTSAASFEECEKLGTADQDFENETTTYTFEDGSKLQHNNSEIKVVGE